MGKGYCVRCTQCGYHRDLLLGQGDDDFYEFHEETLFLCHDCHQLAVITTPRPYDVLVHMHERGFTKPWSEVTALDDNPRLRRQRCLELIERYREGDFAGYLCSLCGSANTEECDDVPVLCPACNQETLEITREFPWD